MTQQDDMPDYFDVKAIKPNEKNLCEICYIKFGIG